MSGILFKFILLKFFFDATSDFSLNFLNIYEEYFVKSWIAGSSH